MSLVITGTPGVGKHTIANKVASKLKMPIIDINKVVLESNQRLDQVDTSKISLDLSVPSIIVGHLAPYCVSPIQVKLVIVLRRNPYDLFQIYESRKYSKDKITDNISSEILDVIFYDAKQKFNDKAIQILVTKDTTHIVLSAINEKYENININWLDLVSKKGDLGRFFSYLGD